MNERLGHWTRAGGYMLRDRPRCIKSWNMWQTAYVLTRQFRPQTIFWIPNPGSKSPVVSVHFSTESHRGKRTFSDKFRRVLASTSFCFHLFLTTFTKSQCFEHVEHSRNYQKKSQELWAYFDVPAFTRYTVVSYQAKNVNWKHSSNIENGVELKFWNVFLGQFSVIPKKVTLENVCGSLPSPPPSFSPPKVGDIPPAVVLGVSAGKELQKVFSQ